MKKQFQQHCASICSRYKRKSIELASALFTLRMLINMVPIMHELPVPSTSNSLAYLVYLSITMLGNSMQTLASLSIIPIVSISMCCLIVVHPFWPKLQLNLLYESISICFPLFLWAIVETEDYIEAICAIVAIWLIKIVLLQPSCLQPESCLNVLREVVEMGVFIVQCFVFKWDDFGVKSLATALALNFCMAIWCTLSVGYASERLDKIRIRGWFCTAAVTAGRLIALSVKSTPEDTILSIAVGVVAIFSCGLSEYFMKCRYQFYRNNFGYCVVLLNSLCFRAKSEIEQSNQIMHQIGNDIRSVVKYIEEKFSMTRKVRYGQLLACYYFHNMQMIKVALSITSIKGLAKNFLQQIQQKTLVLILERFQQGASAQGCYIKKCPSIGLHKVIQEDAVLKYVISKVQECLNYSTLFAKMLLLPKCTEADLVEKLLKTDQVKKVLEQEFQKYDGLVLKSREGIMAYYLFLNVCKSRKFLLLEDITKHFEEIKKVSEDMCPSPLSYRHQLICLVSGQDDSIGVILNTNSLMRHTFGFSNKLVTHKQVNISQIMPKEFAPFHNTIIMNFKVTGEARFLNQTRNLLTVGRQNIIRMEIYSKISAFNNGLVFIGSLKPMKNSGQYALYNETGILTDCSKLVKKRLGWTLEKKTERFIRKSNYSSVTSTQKLLNIESMKVEIQQPTNSMRFSSDFPLRSTYATINSFPVQLYREQIFGNIFVGVCKFLSLDQGFASTSHNLFESRLGIDSYTHASIIEPKQEARDLKRLQQLQYNISAKSLASFPSLFPLCLSSILVFVLSFPGLLWLNKQHTLAFQQTSNIVRANTYSVKTMLLRAQYTVVSMILLNGVYRGNTTQTIMADFNIPTYSQYVIAGFHALLAQTGEAQKWLVNLAENIPQPLVRMMLQKKFGEWSMVSDLRFDLISDLGFKNSMYSQSLSMSKDHYLFYWDKINVRLSYIQSDVDFWSLKQYHRKQLESIEDQIRWLNKLILFQAVSLVSFVVASAAVYFMYYFRLLRTVRSFVNFLKLLDKKNVEVKIEKNSVAKNILELLRRNPVNKLNLESSSKIKVDLYEQEYEFIHGNILPDQRQLLNGISSDTKQKRQIEHTIFFKKEPYGWFPMLVVTTLAIIGLLRTVTSNDIMEQKIKTFFEVDESLNDLQQTQIFFMNIMLSRFINKETNVSAMSIPADQFYDIMKVNLYQRTFEDIVSTNPSWSDFALHIYDSLCPPKDSICHRALDGSLVNGWPAAITYFSTMIFQTYDMIRNGTAPQSTLNTLVELHYGYNQYFRPLLKKYKHTNKQIVLDAFAAEQDTRYSLVYMAIVVYIFLLMIVTWGVKRARSRLQIVVYEILTFGRFIETEYAFLYGTFSPMIVYLTKISTYQQKLVE